MTETTLEMKIGQLAAQRPEALAVLERLGIDFCCGGDRSLNDACQAANVDPQHLLAEVDRASTNGDNDSTTDWLSAPLTELCDHIEQTHHAFLREHLPLLKGWIDKVVEAHAAAHPELPDVRSAFQDLCDELAPHMMKEEQILFPAIRAMERADETLAFPFGTVQNPINMMEHEHDNAGQGLRRLRELTNGFALPADACMTYQAMMDGLKRLETDLHQHIHKENNILFPRAVELEKKLQTTP